MFKEWTNRQLYNLLFPATAKRALIGIGLVIVLLLSIFAALFGAFSSTWPEIPNDGRVLPKEVWPEMSAQLNDRFFAEGEKQNLHERLELLLAKVNDNRTKPNPEPIAEADTRADANSPVELEQWAWVDEHGCGVSGWKGDAGKYIAVLVHKGVWGCGSISRTAAGLPFVAWWGRNVGLLATFGSSVLIGVLIWLLIGLGLRINRDAYTHRVRYMSRLAD